MTLLTTFTDNTYFSNTQKLYQGAISANSTFYLVLTQHQRQTKTRCMHYHKWINFPKNYVSGFSRIFAFSIKHKPHEISKNLPSMKFDIHKISSEIWKWMIKVDLVIFHVFFCKQLNKVVKPVKIVWYRRLRFMMKHTLSLFRIGGGGVQKGPTYQFVLCNCCKRRNLPPKLFNF